MLMNNWLNWLLTKTCHALFYNEPEIIMSKQTIPTPTEIKLHSKSHELEISFEDGSNFHFSSEFLRVHSPSAEVRGHAPGEETLQIDKENVNIKNLEPVGNYAIKIDFTCFYCSFTATHRTGFT